ncbi:hypothetical protein [Hydrogenimonas sp.]|uniref:hypothetical protein n=1 Tax=Hydrogenimonas sp. TaxID=2231112 RepID=UPI002637E9F4|nr:hypothetical protein [Hydrogenimonas sp.]
MRLLRSILTASLFLFLFGGCQQESQRHQRPIVMGQEQQKVTYAKTILDHSVQPKTDDLKIKKMELKTEKEIETIRAQKELDIARLKAESEKSKIETEKEITLKQLQADRKMVGWVITLSALFLFLLLWVSIKLFREYQKYRLRLEEEKMRHQKEMQEKELQTRLVEKMFEALESGNLTEEQQNRLLESISNPNRQIPFRK